MRIAAALLITFGLCFTSAARASIVIHDGAPGIVAMFQGSVLDSDGIVWISPAGGEWRVDTVTSRRPPMPISEIKFWEDGILITMDDEYWRHNGEAWEDQGPWPGVVGLEDRDPEPPQTTQAYPNPTDDRTTIQFQVPEQGDISVRLLDVAGRVVRELIEGRVPSGEYSLTWDGRDESGQPLPGGVYYAKIRIAEREVGQRIVLVR